MTKRKRIDFLLLLLIILNVFDVGSTHILINNGATELNPIINWLMSHFGVFWGMIYIKIPVLASVVLLVRSSKITNNPKLYKQAIISLIAVVAFYAIGMITCNGPGLIYLWWFGSSVG